MKDTTKTIDQQCAIVGLYFKFEDQEITDNIHTSLTKHLNRLSEQLKKDACVLHHKKSTDRLILCLTNCLAAATVALKYRDLFLSINWKEDGFHGRIIPIIVCHYGMATLHKNEISQKLIDATGNNIRIVNALGSCLDPGRAYCSKQFSNSLKSLDNNNTKDIFIGKYTIEAPKKTIETYSIHWENESVTVNKLRTSEDCQELVTSLREELTSKITQNSQKEIASLFKEAMCLNQGKIVQYIQTAKGFLNSIDSLLPRKKSNANRIKAALSNLKLHFYSSYTEIAQKNFYYYETIRRKHGCKQELRIQTKLPATFDNGASTTLFTYGRNIPENYDGFFPGYNPETHTATLKVKATGEWYICNNIPKCAKEEKFTHPRLNQEKILTYTPTDEGTNSSAIDEDWNSCWNVLKENNNIIYTRPASCFKSIMVVPMTLFRNSLPYDFWSSLYESTKSHLFDRNTEIDDFARTTFGYFCVDSTELDCFNADFDINIGYFFADILSMYYFTIHAISSFSKAYIAADILSQPTPLKATSQDPALEKKLVRLSTQHPWLPPPPPG